MRLLIDSRRSNVFNESNEELDEVLEENLVPSTLNVNEEPGEPLCVVCHNPTSPSHMCIKCHGPCHLLHGTPVGEDGFGQSVIFSLCRNADDAVENDNVAAITVAATVVIEEVKQTVPCVNVTMQKT